MSVTRWQFSLQNGQLETAIDLDSNDGRVVRKFEVIRYFHLHLTFLYASRDFCLSDVNRRMISESFSLYFSAGLPALVVLKLTAISSCSSISTPPRRDEDSESSFYCFPGQFVCSKRSVFAKMWWKVFDAGSRF